MAAAPAVSMPPQSHCMAQRSFKTTGTCRRPVRRLRDAKFAAPSRRRPRRRREGLERCCPVPDSAANYRARRPATDGRRSAMSRSSCAIQASSPANAKTRQIALVESDCPRPATLRGPPSATPPGRRSTFAILSKRTDAPTHSFATVDHMETAQATTYFASTGARLDSGLAADSGNGAIRGEQRGATEAPSLFFLQRH